MQNWTLSEMLPQHGRVAIVTGATSGLGLETARALGVAGAQVILTGRNDVKGAAALDRVRQSAPHAVVSYEPLDLARLDSVRRFSDSFAKRHNRLDLLINNAGIMAIPKRHVTADGFELQFGTNYLGHFALTGLLLPLLRPGTDPRVIDVSSLAHRRGRIDFADPQGKRYTPWKAYSQSKLAMLMFALEFQRRSAALGWGVKGIAAHPGLSVTNIFITGPSMGGRIRWMERLAPLAFSLVGQSAAAGALPILYAATMPNVQAGGYYGPTGFQEFKGPPGPAFTAPHARDETAGAKLWDLSVHLTGVDPAALLAAAVRLDSDSPVA